MPEDVAPRPDDLAQALRALAASRAGGGVPIDCRIPSDARRADRTRGRRAAYRICEEALDNALLHSHARHIAVELIGREDRHPVRIFDDGDGFDIAALQGDGMESDERARARGAGPAGGAQRAPRRALACRAVFPLAK
jgi:signal transduction histidine kinase